MPVNHSLEVILSKGKGASFRNPTSPVSGLREINRKSTGSFDKYFTKLDKAVEDGTDGITLGQLGSFGMSAIKAVTQVADVGLNLLFDIDYAITNEKITFNNRKKTKNYVFNPVQYVADMTYGKWLADLSIRRENQANDRARDLSGSIVLGNQFGNKR